MLCQQKFGGRFFVQFQVKDFRYMEKFKFHFPTFNIVFRTQLMSGSIDKVSTSKKLKKMRFRPYAPATLGSNKMVRIKCKVLLKWFTQQEHTMNSYHPLLSPRSQAHHETTCRLTQHLQHSNDATGTHINFMLLLLFIFDTCGVI